MALSGSYDWTLTRDDIIAQALEDIQVVKVNETPNSDQLTVASRRLNGIVKRLQNEDIFLWTREWVTQTFTASDAVTNNSTVYRCIKGHTSSATDEPGVGADWSTYWVEDSSVTSGGAWVTATGYTSVGDFTVAADTIGIDRMFIRDGENDYDVDIVSMAEYMGILTKHNEGKPTKAVFDRQSTPIVYLYKQPDTTDYVLHYARVRKLQDFDAGSDNFDGPESWLPLLIKMLAYDLCAPYGVATEERLIIKREVDELKAMVKRNDHETTSGDFLKGAF
jgi:hypothetical protein